MKSYTLLIVFLLLVFGSCNNDDTNSDCQPEKFYSDAFADKTISITYNTELERDIYTVDDGDHILFQYDHIGYQCDYIADDEWQARLTFQIEAGVGDFEFVDAQIHDTHCYYQQFGAWINPMQYPIETGRITGEKISSTTWRITVDIKTTPVLDGEEVKSITFTEDFTLQ